MSYESIIKKIQTLSLAQEHSLDSYIIYNSFQLHYGTKFNYNDKIIYKGGFLNGKRHGLGKYTYTNGDIYNGSWKEGYRNGYGEYYETNGKVWKGTWVLGDKREGYYTYTFIGILSLLGNSFLTILINFIKLIYLNLINFINILIFPIKMIIQFFEIIYNSFSICIKNKNNNDYIEELKKIEKNPHFKELQNNLNIERTERKQLEGHLRGHRVSNNLYVTENNELKEDLERQKKENNQLKEDLEPPERKETAIQRENRKAAAKAAKKYKNN